MKTQHKSKEEDHFKSNHDLLREINLITRKHDKSNKPIVSNYDNTKSRPSLIQRKTNDLNNKQNIGDSNNLSISKDPLITAVRKLIGFVEKLMKESQGILPIIKHKIKESINDVQECIKKTHQQQFPAKKRINTNNYDKIQVLENNLQQYLEEIERNKLQIIRLNKKIQASKIKRVRLEEENKNLKHASSKKDQSLQIAQEKKLRNIILNQSKLINQQLEIIESQKSLNSNLKHCLQNTDVLHMVMIQAKSVEELLEEKC